MKFICVSLLSGQLVFFATVHDVNGSGFAPEESVKRMTVADGFAVDLVAAEPLVPQPVAIDFDDRGRLWALQYLRYPNPAGLKRVKLDRYSRTTYDRVPQPPPHGPKTVDQLRGVAPHYNAEIDSLVRKHRGNIRAGIPEEKVSKIRRINNDLRAGLGNIAAGRLIFAKRCSGCHKLLGTDKEIGPDLTKENRGDLDFLLVSMVNPNTQIRKEYLSYSVQTVNGRVVTGLLTAETDASVTVLGAKNERTTISRDDVDQIKVSPTSLMPENILKELKPQELRVQLQYPQSDGQ